MHTIRRTLFVVPADDVAVFEAGAAREVARKERRRLEGWLAAEMEPDDVQPWLEEVTARVLDALERDEPEGTELGTRELTRAVPELKRQVTLGSGKWTTKVTVASRLLFLLAMDGLLVRTCPAGSWRSSQYRWATVSAWRGKPPPPRLEEAEGRAGLARRYLATHAPVTTIDLRWWTGWTAKAAGQALAEVDAVAVELDADEPGWVLPGDAAADPSPEPTVALLPPLDSTPMGWKRRDWYLGPHAGQLFDTNGNIGPSVWADGRIVGGWGQRGDGEVVHELLEEVKPHVAAKVADEAAALTSWMDGVVAIPRFPTPLGRRLSQPTPTP